MSTVAKVFGVLLLLVILAVGGLVIAAMTVDINKYRPQIAEALSKQTGREVKLAGPIHLTITSRGIGLAIEDASIGNPEWASRKEMAGIGRLEVGVELMPLLDKQIVISALDIKNADILLETNGSDQHNWEIKPTEGVTPVPKSTGVPTKASTASSNPPMMPRVNSLSITDSQLAMRDKTGKTSTFKIEKATLSPSDHGTAISLAAQVNGTPIKLSFTSTSPDIIAQNNWPYTADVTYANYHFNSQGRVNVRDKSIEMNPYELTVGDTSLHGQLSADMGGPKTQVKGTILGDKLNPADFKGPEAAKDGKSDTPAANTPENDGAAKPLFSTAPLDLSALKTITASIEATIGEIPVAQGSLKQVNARLEIRDGNLSVSPFKASLGESTMQGDVNLNASSPPRYELTFKAPGVNLATLLEMMGTKPFISGQGNADIQLSGGGASLHDMASNTNGKIVVTAGSGAISAASASGVASGLAQIFAPGTGNPTLNCAAIRFNVANGVAKDDGILADSNASTVAGSGGFNLADETVGMTLRAKPKGVNTRGITPAVKIAGPLMAPSVGLDTSNIAQNAAGVISQTTGNKIAGMLSGALGGSDSAIPAIATAPAGENACVYTLDHKGAAAADAGQGANNTGVKGVAGNAAAKVQDTGKKLLQGLFGH